MALSKIKTDSLADDAVTQAKIADNAVTAQMISDGTIAAADLGSSAVTNAKLSANAVTNIKVDASAAIAASKLDLSTITGPISITRASGIATTINRSGSAGTSLKVETGNIDITAGTLTMNGSTVIANNRAITAGNLTADGVVGTPAGSASAPAYTFSTDTNTGMFKRGTDQIGFTAGGTEALAITSTGIFADTIGNKTSNGNLTLDVAGDITLDADGGSIALKDGGTEFGSITNFSSELHIKATINDEDIVLAGLDGGVATNALRLDMSDAGSAYFNNRIYVPVSIVHTGDTNTSIDFGTDIIDLYTGGSLGLRVSNSTVTVNESGDDKDFRIESSGNANMLFVDGGNDGVGIGTICF